MIKLYFEEKENSKAFSEKFVRNILGKYLDADGDNLVIYKTEYGKPYLKDYPDTHYNISHTKSAIVCAVSDEPVGVDIERSKEINKRIVKHFFTVIEQDYVLENICYQDERFIEIWTKKEAYVKWIGQGIAIPFSSFEVSNEEKLYSFLHGAYTITICSKVINQTNCADKKCYLIDLSSVNKGLIEVGLSKYKSE